MKNLTNNQKRWLTAMFLGTAIFLSFAHHALNIWERPAALIILLLAVGMPGFAGVFFLISRKVSPPLSQIPKKRIFLFGLAAILIGSLITWRAFRVPSDYQSITITPVLAEGQTLGLAELKANGGIISLEQAALESGWEEADGILYAGPSSRPLTVSFPCPVNSPVSVLLVNSPESGSASISFESNNIQADLSSPTAGMDETLFSSTYRGLPGGIFIQILILVDILAFSAVLLIALLLQDVGGKSTLGSSEAGNRSPSHRFPLTVLIGLGLLLHLLNALSTSLALGPDSPGYLEGAVHLAQFGNLDGLPVFRGPGTTFLFGPVIWIFGRNPWGLKILLHLIALACIPVSYQIGWQLSRNQSVAFFSGLIAVLSPDLFFYSNYVMADLPNLFFVLLFCWFLVLALETSKWYWIIAAMLTGSFGTLIRSENLLLIVIGFLALLSSLIGQWRKGGLANLKQPLITLGFAFVVAILPVLWWLNLNQRLHGFRGSTDYIGHVIYDGWVYFGNASKLSFTDQNSESVKKIDLAIKEYPILIGDAHGIPTGGEIYPSLIKSGYTPEQAFEILENATWDSIKNNKGLAVELLMLKIGTGLEPKAIPDITFSLPNEPIRADAIKAEFFDTENLSISPLIRLQRWVNKKINLYHPHLYPIWVYFCWLALLLSLFRKPTIIWAALVVIVTTRIFIPLTLGLPFWRFTLSGWIPLQIAAITWIFIFANGIRALNRTNDSTTGKQQH